MEAETNVSVSKKHKQVTTNKASGKAMAPAANDEGASKKKGTRESQTFEGFRKVTSASAVDTGHLRHIRDHYRIETGVKTRIPLAGQTIDALMVNPTAKKGYPIEKGYIPISWEFLNYGLRLPASSFVNSDLTAIDHTPSQLGPFGYSTWLTRVASSLPHSLSQERNILYHGKPGKASPSRWHKYWFLAKDAFSDKVHSSFSTVHTTLGYEESPELAEGLKRLEEGFPETLVLDIFCDPDVLIKAGLSKSIDNFPDINLATLLIAKDGKAVVPNQVSYLEVILGTRLLSEMLAPEAPSSSITSTPVVGISSQPMGLEERSSPLLNTPTPADQTEINLEILSPEPSPFRETSLSANLPHWTPTWDVTEGSSRAAEGIASWASQERGFENNHPFFVDLPYTLPLGLQVTQDTVSKPTTSAAEVSYALSLRLSDSTQRGDEVTRLKTALVSVEKEKDEALSKRDELVDLCQKQHSEHKGLLASAREASKIYKNEVERLKETNRKLQAVNEDYEIHITEAQKMLKSYYDKVCGMEAQIEELHRALDTSVEKFKHSKDYRSLLTYDIATLLRNFCHKVAADFPGILSHFTTFVTSLGEDYVVSLFDEVPD
ncbi:hypothetical protein LIER_16611 [Lithospermum erythrorhizon]|uniref:Uncharacterized protein n=1 Tax=Lithospermum erythrorhizon TaxID=34254 RepID=A0AAV3QCQ2_LITER